MANEELEDWITEGAELWEIYNGGGASPVRVSRITPTQIVCVSTTNPRAEYRFNRERTKRFNVPEPVHMLRGRHNWNYLGQASHPQVIEQKVRDATVDLLMDIEQARKAYRAEKGDRAERALALCDAVENAARAARRAILAQVDR